ncbi:MAG: 30S ribosomal protein S3 [Candidatus Diapherotrites archaeon]|nr:30S ribosomal protein S3 [Candidatus Diapherotrites archaeon]
MIERFFIQQNIKKMELEEYIGKKLDRAGFTHIDIVKTPLITRIVLHVAKPGLAIGKGGQTIKQLTTLIAEKYGIDNPQIEIQEIKNPNMNAKVIADRMASLIQKGFSWRSVVFRSVRDIMTAGAQGVELQVKGKLSGKGGRKRKQRIAFGYMKKVGDQTKYVDYAKTAAYPKAGAIGIKLRIIHPEAVFPDKVDVLKVVESVKKAGAASASVVAHAPAAEAEITEKQNVEETKPEESIAGKIEEIFEKKKEEHKSENAKTKEAQIEKAKEKPEEKSSKPKEIQLQKAAEKKERRKRKVEMK